MNMRDFKAQNTKITDVRKRKVNSLQESFPLQGSMPQKPAAVYAGWTSNRLLALCRNPLNCKSQRSHIIAAFDVLPGKRLPSAKSAENVSY
jgi:hypothetical protein